jgi:hypothetical protein
MGEMVVPSLGFVETGVFLAVVKSALLYYLSLDLFRFRSRRVQLPCRVHPRVPMSSDRSYKCDSNR